MFLIITSFLDEDRLSVWMTVFMMGVFMTGIPVRLENGEICLSIWFVGAVKGKSIPGIVTGGQYMPTKFWDDVPAC